ncbi:Rossmann-like and DUF2520 domain-containing protein [Robertkochia sediminum]|uniref:Rossmann-like and DUF2520 domain-containing protein n=1 Tax=Robertkochia sediminum TaxID=2785326 RepID=UPI0019322A95|nr:Rossmann-like and DUF2520 domain-containing protein [Robertkochia sediminum]MBL7473207.1 DUF2520 domain-containing protein [Robertkochia sediminum]
MRTVIIIGYGNVAQAIAPAINASKGFTVKQILHRTPGDPEQLPPFPIVNSFDQLEEADIYMLCVNDDAISEVSQALPFSDRLVVHTSGSIPMDTLADHKRRGVFYPLQSFTKGKRIAWKEVPLCLESAVPEDLELLKALAAALSPRVYEINSEQRKKIHLSAVVVNNFTNHLYYLAETLCKEHDIPFEILHPLLLETAQKVQRMDPYTAQTGPARRNDQKTLNSQLIQVRNTPLEEVYKVLTASILATYEREKL